MLAIRLQRTGRSGHTQFRVIVQDSRFSPTRGRIVAYLGNYDPHTKASTLDSAKAAQYLQSGAQPSDTVARLFKKEGIKLPAWVKLDEPKKRETRNPEKRRSTRPAGSEAPAPAAAPADETASGEPATETAAEDTPSEEVPAEPAAEDQPANPEIPPDEEAPSGEAPTETSPEAAPAPETPNESQ